MTAMVCFYQSVSHLRRIEVSDCGGEDEEAEALLATGGCGSITLFKWICVGRLATTERFGNVYCVERKVCRLPPHYKEDPGHESTVVAPKYRHGSYHPLISNIYVHQSHDSRK